MIIYGDKMNKKKPMAYLKSVPLWGKYYQEDILKLIEKKKREKNETQTNNRIH